MKILLLILLMLNIACGDISGGIVSEELREPLNYLESAGLDLKLHETFYKVSEDVPKGFLGVCTRKSIYTGLEYKTQKTVTVSTKLLKELEIRRIQNGVESNNLGLYVLLVHEIGHCSYNLKHLPGNGPHISDDNFDFMYERLPLYHLPDMESNWLTFETKLDSLVQELR